MEELKSVESSINAAFDVAHQEYPLGHLKGEQIKNYLRLAMSLVNPEAAMVLAGKINTSPNGPMKAKLFPIDKLQVVQEPPNFTSAASQEDAQLAATETDQQNELIDIVTNIVSMKPATAVSVFGIEAINAMISNLGVEITEGANDNQKAAALIQFLKQSKKKK